MLNPTNLSPTLATSVKMSDSISLLCYWNIETKTENVHKKHKFHYHFFSKEIYIFHLHWLFLEVLKVQMFFAGLNPILASWSRWGHKSWLFPCHNCDIRAPAGIQAQQLGPNVDSLESTESSWGQTSVCQSPGNHGNRVNTAANCQVKLKPRWVMFQCHPKANLARMHMPDGNFCWHRVFADLECRDGCDAADEIKLTR